MDFETPVFAAGHFSEPQRARAEELAREAPALTPARLTARLLHERTIDPVQAEAILRAIEEATPSLPDADQSGRRIGPYRLLKRLSGERYFAEHSAVGHEVVIRMLPRTDRLQPVREEAMRLARLRHPNLITLQDVATQDDSPYVVLAHVEGIQISEAALPAPPLAWTTLTAWMIQVCRGLGALHAAGLVHRNVMPTSLWMGTDGLIRLTDVRLGGEGGTPGYIAPEEARGEVPDARADLYGLAATFHTLIAGAPPFPAATPAGTLLRQLREAASPDALLARDVPMALVKVLLRLLDADPRNRFSSARELEIALTSVQHELAEEAAAALPPPARSRRPLSKTAAAVAIALLMTAALGVVAALVRRSPPPAPIVAPPPPEPAPAPFPDKRKTLIEEAAIAERRGALETSLALLQRAAAISSSADLQNRIAEIERVLRDRLREQTDFEKLQSRLANLPDEAASKACAEFIETHPKSRYTDRALRWKQEIAARVVKLPVGPVRPPPVIEPPSPVERPPAVKGRELDASLIAAIMWLVRHQGDDGLWSEAGSTKRCTGRACSSLSGSLGQEVGVSALAVMAILGAGYCLQDCDDYGGINVGAALRSAILSLARGRAKDGNLAPAAGEKAVYCHSMALWAIADAVRTASIVGPVRKQDIDELRTALQQGTEWLLWAQAFRGGWRYTPKSGADPLVTSWAVHALEAARRAGMKVPEGSLSDAAAWIATVTDDATCRVGYTERGTGKVFMAGVNEQYNHHETTTAAGWLTRVVAAPSGTKPAQIDAALKLVLADLPSATQWARDYYYWYHGARFIRRCGRDADVARWRQAAFKAITACREPAGCAAGSWDVQDRWSLAGGRVFATAINALTLEILLTPKPAEAAPPPPKPETTPAWIVFLKSGGRLRASSTEDRGDKLFVQLVAGGTTTLDRESVDRVEKYDPKKHE